MDDIEGATVVDSAHAAVVQNKEEYNPFQGEGIFLSINITLMKIYDVLMELLANNNPEIQQQLEEYHSKGILVNELPLYLSTLSEVNGVNSLS